MGPRPSLGRRPASLIKDAQDTLPSPPGVRQNSRRRRDRGAPPVLSSGASRTQRFTRWQHLTAQPWHWGVLAGPILISCPHVADGASSRWPVSTPPSQARHGEAARWCPLFPPAHRRGSKSGSQFTDLSSRLTPTPARPARTPGIQGAPSGGTAAFPLLRKGLARSPAHTFPAQPNMARRPKRSTAPRTATACSRGGLARRLGVAAARRPSSVHPDHLQPPRNTTETTTARGQHGLRQP
jgi:hypothetical protein